MDASNRGALMLVRFIAIALMGIGVIELGLYRIESSVHHTPMRIFHFALPAILFVPGVVILFKAGAIAEWISNKLDE
jgi:hypothetical protein